jgi:plastocyanin
MRLFLRTGWSKWLAAGAATILLVAVPAAVYAQQAITEQTTEFQFSNPNISVRANEPVRITIQNMGAFPHTIAFDEGSGANPQAGEPVQGGATGVVNVTFSRAGSFEFWCPVGNHRERGMVGTITIVAGAQAGGGAAGRAGGLDPVTTAAGIGLLGALATGAGLLRRRRASA